MKDFWDEILEFQVTEMFLISFILLLIFSTTLFIVLTFASRIINLKKEIYRKRKNAHIDKILFAVAFNGAGFGDFKNDQIFKRNWRKQLYREQFLFELIKLHRLYDGEAARNLRQCYLEFKLVQLSYSKLKSRKWEIKCAGIKELGEMKVKEAVPALLEHTEAKNNTLKMVALIEVIHLSGLEGLWLLESYKEPLNDWIQLNLLEFIKEAVITEVPDFGYLLKSPNETTVVFGLRLITLFNQSHHLPAVQELRRSSSRKTAVQAKTAYHQLHLIQQES